VVARGAVMTASNRAWFARAMDCDAEDRHDRRT
jgi:hypothetical protein